MTYLYLPFFFFRFSVHLNLFGFDQPSPLKKLDIYFSFFFCSPLGTTFENAVSESSPRKVSTGKLNLMLIIIVLLAIFLLAIAVVLGILSFRRHQSRKNQGKFLASFAYLHIISYIHTHIYIYIYIYIYIIFFFFFFFFFNMMSRISKHKVEFYSLVWYSALLSWCEVFFTRLVLPSNGVIECAFISHFAGSFAFLQMLYWLYLDLLCLRWILQQAFYCAFGFWR